MRYLILLHTALLFYNCQISWYVNSSDPERSLVFDPSKRSCFISNLRYLPVLNVKTKSPFNPLAEIILSDTTYTIQKPEYIGLDPEFITFLKQRLKTKNKIEIITQLYNVPISFKENPDFQKLYSKKSFSRFEEIAKSRKANPAFFDLLKTYADIMDERTIILYENENPYTHNIESCDNYFYFSKYRNEENQYNLQFLLTLGLLPDFRYQNHHYEVLYRKNANGKIESFPFVIGYRKSLSLLYIPTFSLYNTVSDFDQEYKFSEESEEMFLDLLAKQMERYL